MSFDLNTIGIVKDMKEKLVRENLSIPSNKLITKEIADDLITKYENIAGHRLPRNSYNNVKEYLIKKEGLAGNPQQKKVMVEGSKISKEDQVLVFAGMKTLAQALNEAKKEQEDEDEEEKSDKVDESDASDDDEEKMDEAGEVDPNKAIKSDKELNVDDKSKESDKPTDKNFESEEEDEEDKEKMDEADSEDDKDNLKVKVRLNEPVSVEGKNGIITAIDEDSKKCTVSFPGDKEEGEEDKDSKEDGEVEKKECSYSELEPPISADKEKNEQQGQPQKDQDAPVPDEKEVEKVKKDVEKLEDPNPKNFESEEEEEDDDLDESKGTDIYKARIKKAKGVIRDYVQKVKNARKDHPNWSEDDIKDYQDTYNSEADRYRKALKQLRAKMDGMKSESGGVEVDPVYAVGTPVMYNGNLPGQVIGIQNDVLTVSLKNGGTVKDNISQFKIIDQNPSGIAAAKADMQTLGEGSKVTYEGLKGQVLEVSKGVATVRLESGAILSHKVEVFEIAQSEPENGDDLNDEMLDKFSDERTSGNKKPDSRDELAKIKDAVTEGLKSIIENLDNFGDKKAKKFPDDKDGDGKTNEEEKPVPATPTKGVEGGMGDKTQDDKAGLEGNPKNYESAEEFKEEEKEDEEEGKKESISKSYYQGIFSALKVIPESHLSTKLEKLGVSNIVEALEQAVTKGYIAVNESNEYLAGDKLFN